MRTLLGGAMAIALLLAPGAGADTDWDAVMEEWEPDEDGFIHLFNGEDLEGWHIQGSSEGFSVEDGVIRSVGGLGGDWMYWDVAEFSDFELVVEWRVSEDGNSGVFIRVPPEGQPWVTGYEVQIVCETHHREDHHCTGSLYDYVAVDPRPDETPEVWREFVIRAEGDHIQVFWEGEQIIDYDQSTQERTQDKPLSGFIGVQDSHAAEGTWVEFRTIKARPLS